MAPADRVQERTISHTGSELGADMVTRSQNQVAPQRKTEIIAFQSPRKFESVRYRGARHWTKMILRALLEETSDGTDTVVLGHDLLPIAGEEDIEDQPFRSSWATM